MSANASRSNHLTERALGQPSPAMVTGRIRRALVLDADRQASLATLAAAALLTVASAQSIVAGVELTLLWLGAWVLLACSVPSTLLPVLLLLATMSPMQLPLGGEGGLPLWYMMLLLVPAIGLLKKGLAVPGRTLLVARQDLESLVGLLLIVTACFVSMVAAGSFDIEAYGKLICILAAVLMTVWLRPSLNAITKAFIAGGWVIGAQIIFQKIGLLKGVQGELPFGLGFDYGAFHGAVAGGLIGSAAVLAVAHRQRGALRNLLYMPVPMLGILLSGKRTWLLALAAAFAVYFLTRLKAVSNPRRVLFWAASGATVAVVAAVASNWTQLAGAFDTLLDVFLHDMAKGRVPKWTAALAAFAEQPFFGAGFQGLDLSEELKGLRGDSGAKNADSFYVNILAQLGLLNLLLVLLGLLVLARQAIRPTSVLSRDRSVGRTWISVLLTFWLVGCIFWDPYGNGASAAALAILAFAAIRRDHQADRLLHPAPLPTRE